MERNVAREEQIAIWRIAGATYAEIGEAAGISGPRIQQIHGRFLSRIRALRARLEYFEEEV